MNVNQINDFLDLSFGTCVRLFLKSEDRALVESTNTQYHGGDSKDIIKLELSVMNIDYCII
jgi:hypothetical protein